MVFVIFLFMYSFFSHLWIGFLISAPNVTSNMFVYSAFYFIVQEAPNSTCSLSGSSMYHFVELLQIMSQCRKIPFFVQHSAACDYTYFLIHFIWFIP